MRLLSHLVAFLLGWQASIFGAARDWPFLGPLVVGGLLVWHAARATEPARRLRLMCVVGLVGTIVDSTSILTGLFTPTGTHRGLLCPLWMTALWINFAMLLDAVLRGLAVRPFVSAAVGGVALPVNYTAAAGLSALTALQTPAFSISAWALVGGILLPILLWLSHQPMFAVVSPSSPGMGAPPKSQP